MKLGQGRNWNTADIPRQTGRLAVVTGATGGLGFETALELARADATAVRGHARALSGLAGNLGCAELERAARRLVMLRETADRDELDRHLTILTEAASRALAALAERFPVGQGARVVPLPTRRP